MFTTIVHNRELSHRARTSLPISIARITIVALLCVTGCKKKADKPALPPPTVEVATVSQSDVPIYHDWIGVIDGLVNAHIRAQVVGYLQSQNYTEGDPIKKGDLLFQIDPRPFKASLDQAKGQLAQAEARLGKTELDVKRYGRWSKTKPSARKNTMTPCRRTLKRKRRSSLPKHKLSRRK